MKRATPLRVTFGRPSKVECHNAWITSDGVLAYRELDDALGFTTKAVWGPAEGLRGSRGISAGIVCHGRYVVFQLAEVAVQRVLFAEMLRCIERLCVVRIAHRV